VARRIVSAAARLLAPGGWLLLEIGGDQDQALAPELAASGFGDVESWRDEDGDLRGVAARALSRRGDP
jgi:release factor glutamine methyltransferase